MSQISQARAYIFRITHIDNVPWILRNGIHCQNSPVRDPNFSTCPALAELPVVPVGNGTIGSFRVLVPPYTAGPWVEGVYEIALETGPVLPHVAPRFAGAFAKP